MTPEEIIEGNKLIAEFIGAKFHNDDTDAYPNGYWLHESLEYSQLEEFEYAYSWDWLIPIVNMVYKMNSYYIYKNNTAGQFGKDDILNTFYIQETFKSVVEFIKWYNQNIKK